MNGLVGTAKTISYHQGHADGMREALKAIRAITQLNSKNWVSGSLNWHQGINDVLEECTRMLEDDLDIIERGRRLVAKETFAPDPEIGE